MAERELDPVRGEAEVPLDQQAEPAQAVGEVLDEGVGLELARGPLGLRLGPRGGGLVGVGRRIDARGGVGAGGATGGGPGGVVGLRRRLLRLLTGPGAVGLGVRALRGGG